MPISYDQVINLTKQGYKQKEISEKLDINKSNVSRHLKRAHQEGRILATKKKNQLNLAKLCAAVPDSESRTDLTINYK